MIEELIKQLEDFEIKNDNLTKINVDLANQLEDLAKTDNKPTINWTKNKLITFCKNNNISGYLNCNKTKLVALIHSKQHNFINNVSPLRYPGGKTKPCNKLYEILTTYFDLSKFTTIISPFFGGGSFEFHLQNNFPNLHIIANDKFTPLYNFWNTCKDNNDKLCKELYPYINTITKNTFQDLRNKILTETDPLKQSIMFFIINRCSFSGATLSGGFSLESSIKRFTITSIERISKLHLDRLTITNMDFEEFLQNKNSLIFLDPPYYLESKSNLYGNNGDLHEHFDHIKLHKCLSNKNNWIMTYNNCNYIKDLYKNYKIIETYWNYGMNKSKKSNEIVIICYN